MTDESSIPYFLKENVYLKANLTDSNILSFHLDQFLLKQKSLSRKWVDTQTPYHKRPPLQNKKYFLQLESKLASLIAECSGIEFSNFLEDFLRNQGFVVESSQGPKLGADMSIWVDSLEKTLGNPILIETKCGKLSERRLELSEMQLREILKKSNLRSGILVYLDKDSRQFQPSKFTIPFVIRFEISDLIKKLTKEPLDCVLLKERNKIAHGGIVE